MEHDILLTCADGSVRCFRVYGREAPRVGDTVTLPVDGKLVKARIRKTTGAEIVAWVDHGSAEEKVPLLAS